MVDIVVNHNGWNGNETSVDYSVFKPFDDIEYYHSFCDVDYSNNTSIQDCWLGDSNVELVDLRTEDTAVAQEYQTWIQQLVANYSSKLLVANPEPWLTLLQLMASVSILSSMSTLRSGLDSERLPAFSSLAK